MAEKAVLFCSVFTASMMPFMAQYTGFSSTFLFPILFCILVWAQELFVVQSHYNKENLEFSRRFRAKSNDINFFMKNLHIVISFSVICCLISIFDSVPSIAGFFLILFSFLGLLRVLDPLLGCVISDEQNKFSSGMAYVIVFTFAVSSGLDPSRYSNYLLPEALVGSFFFGVVAYTSLNLRMAYYKRFCFRHELSLESQLRLVLIPLMILAVHQMLSALYSIDLQSVFGV